MRGTSPYATRGSPLTLPNGTVTNPALRFLRERTGFYRAGDGRLATAVKGFRAMEVTQNDTFVRSNSAAAVVSPLAMARATATSTAGHQIALDAYNGATQITRMSAYTESANSFGYRWYTTTGGVLQVAPSLTLSGDGNLSVLGSVSAAGFSGSSANLTGAGTFGSLSVGGATFTVSGAGAVVGTSLNAGSGIIQTTGALSGGTALGISGGVIGRIGTAPAVGANEGTTAGAFVRRHANTATPISVSGLEGQSTGVVANNWGVYEDFHGQSSTTAGRQMGQVGFVWTTAADATRSSAFVVNAVNSAAALAEVFRVTSLGFGTLSTFKANNAAFGSAATVDPNYELQVRISALGHFGYTQTSFNDGSGQAISLNNAGTAYGVHLEQLPSSTPGTSLSGPGGGWLHTSGSKALGLGIDSTLYLYVGPQMHYGGRTISFVGTHNFIQSGGAIGNGLRLFNANYADLWVDASGYLSFGLNGTFRSALRTDGWFTGNSTGHIGLQLGNHETYASATALGLIGLAVGATGWLSGTVANDLAIGTSGASAGRLVLGSAGTVRVVVDTAGDTNVLNKLHVGGATGAGAGGIKAAGNIMAVGQLQSGAATNTFLYARSINIPPNTTTDALGNVSGIFLIWAPNTAQALLCYIQGTGSPVVNLGATQAGFTINATPADSSNTIGIYWNAGTNSYRIKHAWAGFQANLQLWQISYQ